MAKKSIRNQGGNPFLTLKGIFVVKTGQQPDGDTIRFAATAGFRKGSVDVRIETNRKGDKSTPLRLQSIDAPEKAQPLGAASRDALLRFFDFPFNDLGLGNNDFTAQPTTDTGAVCIPGWVATHGMDIHGRALSYLFQDNPGFQHGKELAPEQLQSVLKQSANYRAVAAGWAFPAFYDNTEELQAVLFQAAADAARKKKLGVWKLDRTTTGFEPTKQALDSDGALIYPKFFRRVAQWKAAKADSRAFINWLKKHEDGKKMVQGAKTKPVPLWTLFEPVGSRRVAVPYDVTKLWFSETVTIHGKT